MAGTSDRLIFSEAGLIGFETQIGGDRAEWGGTDGVGWQPGSARTGVLELGAKKVLHGAVGATFCSTAPKNGAKSSQNEENGEDGGFEKPRKIRVFRRAASGTPLHCTHDGWYRFRCDFNRLEGSVCTPCSPSDRVISCCIA